jgi:hypothetical protein
MLEVAYIHASDQGRLRLSFASESNDRANSTVSPDRTRVIISYRFAPVGKWTIESLLQLRNSQFAGLMLARKERLKELGIAAHRNLESGWQLGASVRIRDNESNNPIFDYTRSRVSLGLSKTF